MKLTTWIVIAAVLVIGLGTVFLVLHKNAVTSKNQSAASKAQAVASQPKAVYAAAGKLVSTFPTDLLLGADQNTQSSFSVSYASATQSTVVFVSNTTMDALYNKYSAYFQSNKYEVLSQKVTAQMAQIYAINKDGDVNVQIIPNGSQSKATVSYLKK